jgi:hypothetical protein
VLAADRDSVSLSGIGCHCLVFPDVAWHCLALPQSRRRDSPVLSRAKGPRESGFFRPLPPLPRPLPAFSRTPSKGHGFVYCLIDQDPCPSFWARQWTSSMKALRLFFPLQLILFSKTSLAKSPLG